MPLQRYLKITLTVVGSEINVQLRGEGFAISNCNANTRVPFSSEELSVTVRALEINRALPGSFNEQEWKLLKQWGVVSGEITSPEKSGEIQLHEEEIDISQLIKNVQGKLFYTLFPENEKDFEKQLEVVLSELQPSDILHIRIEIPSRAKDELLHQFPWEILCFKSEHFRRHHVSIARYIQGVQFARQVNNSEQANILIVRSHPTGREFNFVQLATDRESIWQYFRELPPNYSIQIKELKELKDVARKTSDSRTELLLQEYLSGANQEASIPQVIHFECHGNFGRRCMGKDHHVTTSTYTEKCDICGSNLPGDFYGYLAFERIDASTPSRKTEAHWISSEELADALKGYSINFVFLNTCDSAIARRSKDVFNGVAQALLQIGIPAVLGTAFRVESEAARKFAQYFYGQLGQRGSLIDALDYARQKLVNDPNTGREWYRYVLYFGHQAELAAQFFVETSAKDLSSKTFSGKDMSYQTLIGWNLEKTTFLNKADLSGSLLIDASLKGANLVGATLAKTDFSGANLVNCDFTEADLRETCFLGADLSSANLNRTKFYTSATDDIVVKLEQVNLSSAYLEEAILTKVRLTDVNLTDAKLSGATLTGAKLANVRLERANLSSADLSEVEFEQVNLSGADLRGAKLSGAILSNVNLRDANLSAADLRKVDLRQVDLRGADLKGIQVDASFSFGRVQVENAKFDGYLEKIQQIVSKQGNFQGIDLSKTIHLKNQDLSGLDLSRANLSGADLCEANLSNTILEGADLSQARLSGINLQHAHLNRANLTGSDFFCNGDSVPTEGHKVELRGADLEYADLSCAVMRQADLRGANLQEITLDKAVLIQAKLSRANLQSAVLTEVNLSDANLSMADLTRANLRDAILQDTNLTRCNLSEAILTHADLSNAVLCYANLVQARIRGVNLHGADLRGAILGDISLEDEAIDLRGAVLPDGTVVPDEEEDSAEVVKINVVLNDEVTKQ